MVVHLALQGSGRTPLHCAALSGSMDMMFCLMKRKADIDVADAAGELPVGLALAQQFADVVTLLRYCRGSRRTVRTCLCAWVCSAWCMVCSVWRVGVGVDDQRRGARLRFSFSRPPARPPARQQAPLGCRVPGVASRCSASPPWHVPARQLARGWAVAR